MALFILLGLLEAFGTINYSTFLEPLLELGLGDIILQWFWSFLSDCAQKVVLGDYCSTQRRHIFLALLDNCINSFKKEDKS